MTIIALDSSTDVCSAALLRDGELVAERINLVGSNHVALLPTYVQQLQAEASRLRMAIDNIVLSEGPGSYTGLRIGASLAKGLCYGAEVPLTAVPTLAVIAQGAMSKEPGTKKSGALICPMIDARRMEVYCALYDTDMNIVQSLAPVIIDEHSFAQTLEEHLVYFCGNGAEKCKQVIRHSNARWIDCIVPTATQAGLLAEEAISNQQSAVSSQLRRIEGKEIAYFEPNYLKEFIAAPSHIKGLH